MLAVMLRRRMVEAGMDTGGVGAVGVHTVGGVQLATHSWMSHPRMTADELIDYLTMLSWNALCGIVEVGGSLEKFREQPHPSPILPPQLLGTMTNRADLPELWTHEPHHHLVYRQGDKVADVDTSATPGFKGKKNDAAELQPERNERFAQLQEMLYANSRGAGDNRSLLLVLQGMDTAGKGGIVKHVVGAANPQGIRYTAFGVPTEEERKHHYLWRIRRALPAGRAHRRVRPLALRGRAGGPGARPRAARGVGQALRRDQRVREEARRRRHDDRQGGDVRLARRAEAAAVRAARAARQVLEVQPEGRRRAAAVACTTRRPIRRCSSATSTDYAPWHVVPCDRKWYSRLAIIELLIEALEGLNLSWPPADFDIEAEKKRLAEA